MFKQPDNYNPNEDDWGPDEEELTEIIDRFKKATSNINDTKKVGE